MAKQEAKSYTNQVYNDRIDAWVKYVKTEGESPRIIDVKQRNPTDPFDGIPVVHEREAKVMEIPKDMKR